VHSRAPHRLTAAFALVVGLLVGILVAACGLGGPDPQASFSGATLTIQARDLTFAPDIATAPAGQPLRIILDNKDVGVPHNLHVFRGDTEFGKTDSVEGPGMIALELPALAPGRYQFACSIHPNMIGTIIVANGAVAGPSDPAETPPPDGPTDGPDATDAP
jgi:plastocyanin